MPTSVDAALVEIADALAVLEPQLEGLRDFARLNLKPETREEINAAIVQYERREAVLIAAQGNAQALLEDGYPALDIRQIVQAAYDDLQANAATIEAALARFTATQASALRTSAGPAQPKT